MAVSDDKQAAIIVTPAIGFGILRDRRLRRWLSRGNLVEDARPRAMHDRVLAAIGMPPCAEGAGALRFWGTTGDRPATWMAAADPVYLEAGLHNVRLHRLWPDELPATDLRPLFENLQVTLADGADLGFAWIGGGGYLRSSEAMPTAELPPSSLDGREPGDYLPRRPDAAGYHRLLSEVQMTLHADEVGARRASDGRRPVNSLWIWGGGRIPKPPPRPIPPLFSDDPLLRGYWLSAAGRPARWPGEFTACAARAEDGFVAEIPDLRRDPEELAETMDRLLSEARRLLAEGAIRRLTLLTRDGLTATLRTRHAFRLWRREAPVLAGGGAQ